LIWKIDIQKKAKKELTDLNKTLQKRIVSFLKDRLSNLENPRSIGEALHGELKKLWKYRVGDYRLICDIEDNTVTVLVLKISHRKEVYK